MIRLVTEMSKEAGAVDVGSKVFCFLVIVCLFSLQYRCNAADSVSAEVLWRGLDDSRQRVISGMCTLSGTTKKTKNGDSREEHCLIVFDAKSDCYRFDRIGIGNSLQTSEYYFECWSPGTQRSSIMRQPYTTREISKRVDFFDIKMLGFFTFFDPYYDLRYDKDTIANFLKNKKLVALQQHDNGIVAATYEVLPGMFARNLPTGFINTRQIFWINCAQGFSLVRVEYQHGDGDVDTIEITWKEKNKVWVPETCQFSSTQGFNGDWKFDWSLVNEDIPSRYFDVGDLSETVVPVRVFSKELGETVQIGIAGQGKVDYWMDDIRRIQGNSSYFLPRYILLWLGIFIIVLGLCKKVYDYWRRQKSE